ncbi:cation transport ATPase [Desulfocapsa sulfexigens DSM 10523]|uniref:Cation transport ATPase n=1 Tax=Desulfocapsa sulfexigens (strain DSM 10523 / SB164P1) TaxID=1167006 RepID=M1NBY7_DESSD|nr:acyltransferase [Desulfocapsa sulfexigens]AGF77314.1 cation transport ATPase [Desulfocapsa sulfexigens DSM 10523]
MQTQKDTPLFGKEQAAHIKGAAIIMLILHHLFLFPSNKPWFTSIIGNRWGGIEFFISSVSKLCIPLFFFVSGYGLWQASRSDQHLWKSTFRRLRAIYTIYIVTVVITVLLYFFVNGSWVLLSRRHAAETFLGTNIAINGSWWFFIIYVELLLLTPLAVHFVRRFSWLYLALLSSFVYLLSPESGFSFFADQIARLDLSAIMYEPFPLNLLWFNQFYFFTGFCLAASGLFETILRGSIKTMGRSLLRYGIALGLIGAIFCFRYYLIDISSALGILSKEGLNIFQRTLIRTRADFILGPLLIYAMVLLLHHHRLRSLAFLGNHSAPIWLIHGTVIALLLQPMKSIRPWSPLVFFLVLSLCVLYALAYSSVASWLRKKWLH